MYVHRGLAVSRREQRRRSELSLSRWLSLSQASHSSTQQPLHRQYNAQHNLTTIQAQNQAQHVIAKAQVCIYMYVCSITTQPCALSLC